MKGVEERNRRRRSYARIPPRVAVFATELTPPSVMLGLDPSIQTAPVSGRGMDPRLKAEDDGMCGDVSAKLAVSDAGAGPPPSIPLMIVLDDVTEITRALVVPAL
ncbi:hypothetical protein BA011_00115 [Rhizobium leguminosarum]|uniref:Uncharacterized protein n=1 Tax=Rhizobium leguminosarum TaxID=384 RepID=A0A1B1C3J2_RHILE|nr:hypothetical protein BA011_00115 [Rhizobium leguminosarum]